MTPTPVTPYQGPHRPIADEARQFGLVGQSQAHLELLNQIAKLADINVEIFIAGPSGVGKERYARFLHEYGVRRSRAFVAINCGGVPDHLFENELFGHQIGAFTGAQQPAEGLVAAAEGGTLFLDEVDHLSASAQVKLLRLLQEKEYRRLGETRIRRVDVRFIAATNSDLEENRKTGIFRNDLYYRLRVVSIQVPPLRERADDIAVLLLAFIERYAAQYGLEPISFSDGAWTELLRYSWPGNVRELENCVRSLTCLQLGRPITPADLPLMATATPKGANGNDESFFGQSFQDAKRDVVDRFEKEYLLVALQRAGGNITEAARRAGKHRRAFFELLRKHQLDANGVKKAADAAP